MFHSTVLKDIRERGDWFVVNIRTNNFFSINYKNIDNVRPEEEVKEDPKLWLDVYFAGECKNRLLAGYTCFEVLTTMKRFWDGKNEFYLEYGDIRKRFYGNFDFAQGLIIDWLRKNVELRK